MGIYTVAFFLSVPHPFYTYTTQLQRTHLQVAKNIHIHSQTRPDAHSQLDSSSRYLYCCNCFVPKVIQLTATVQLEGNRTDTTNKWQNNLYVEFVLKTNFPDFKH